MMSRVGFNMRSGALFSSVVVLCLMSFLSVYLTGPSSGDWLGYAQLYADQGGWLYDEKRDPGFIFLLNQAHAAFGLDGYAVFRTILSVIFVVFAVWLAYLIPAQHRLAQLGPVAVICIVTAALSLKGFVQVREGMSFLIIVVPVIGMYGRYSNGVIASGIGAIVALSFHSGALVFLGVWIVAVLLAVAPDDLLASRVVQNILLSFGVILGIAVGVFTVKHSDDVHYLLGSYGVNVRVRTISSWLKDLYWAASGLMAWKIRADLLSSASGISRFAYCYASSIASFVLPCTYIVCVILVIYRFEAPSLTSMMIRLFFTVSELSMIIISLRGKMNLATCGIALFMLVDRLRVFGEST